MESLIVTRLLVMLVFAVVVRRPRTDRGSDDDRVDIGGHRMLHVGRNEQEAANGMRGHVLQVQSFPETDLKCALNDRHSRVGAVPVMFMVAGRNEKRISECFTGYVPAPLKQRILGSTRINVLPLDRLSVPRLADFVILVVSAFCGTAPRENTNVRINERT